jgi:hypothetical protein
MWVYARTALILDKEPPRTARAIFQAQATGMVESGVPGRARHLDVIVRGLPLVDLHLQGLCSVPIAMLQPIGARLSDLAVLG